MVRRKASQQERISVQFLALTLDALSGGLEGALAPHPAAGDCERSRA